MGIKKDNSLQDARQAWVFGEIEKLRLANPVTELADKMGYNKSSISEILNKKKPVSIQFFQTFCEQFGFNYDAVNHMLIDEIKKEIEKGNKSSENKSDVNHKNDANNALPSIPSFKIGDYDFMKDFMHYLKEEQRQRAEDQRQRAELIKRIPVEETGQQQLRKAK